MRHGSAKPISIKLLLALFAAGFGIFFGVDVATRGIERINGPIDAVEAQAGPKTAQASPAAAASQPKPKPDQAAPAKPAQGQPQIDKAAKQQAVIEESAVNRVSNGIGDLLRRAANVCLKVIVSLFEAIFG
ncbi:hypothetical protein [Paenibacillus sp. MBLB4367]|uniref:hypothetical protein n=1 Tax=Paenibacillus sp. MBLB4367 TaxID=3384767 RepID=UPI0039081D1D